jgi:hypothetical protein
MQTSLFDPATEKSPQTVAAHVLPIDNRSRSVGTQNQIPVGVVMLARTPQAATADRYCQAKT